MGWSARKKQIKTDKFAKKATQIYIFTKISTKFYSKTPNFLPLKQHIIWCFFVLILFFIYN